jgi:hypothetical protein
MIFSRIFAACTLLLLAAACRAPSAQYVPLPKQDVTVTSKDVTRIYFVRDETSGLRQSEIRVLDGSTEIGLLTTGTYLCWERPGGRTLTKAYYQAIDPLLGNIEGLYDMDCQAGRVYYFNVIIEREQGQPKIKPLGEREGRELVAHRSWAGEK